MKLKSSLKQKQTDLPLIPTEGSLINQNINKAFGHKPLNLDFVEHSKHIPTNSSILTSTTTFNLDEWEEKHINTSTNKQQTQFIAKAEEMANDAAIFQANKKKHLTNQFIKVKTMKSSNEIRQYVKDIENDNTKALKQIASEKKKFNFNVFQTRNESNQPSVPFKGNDISLFSPIKRKAQSFTNIDQSKRYVETNRINPYSIPGALENLINSEVFYQQMNKHKTEKCFNEELGNTFKRIKDLEKEHSLLLKKIDAMIYDLDEKKTKCSNGKDIVNILSNERLLNTKAKKGAFDFERNLHYLDMISIAKSNIDVYQLDYNRQLFQNQRIIPLIKLKIKSIKADIKSLKRLHQSMAQESINYYMRLLQSGIDVRGVGLSWIIAKLAELGKQVTQSDFPSWLNRNNYNFLIEYANKRIEIAKLITLVTLIKKQYIKKTNNKNNYDNSDYNLDVFDKKAAKKKSMSLEKLIGAYRKIVDKGKDLAYVNEKSDVNENVTPEEIAKKLQLIKQCYSEINDYPYLNNDHKSNENGNSIINTVPQMNNTFLLTQQRVFDQIKGEDNKEKSNIRSSLLFLNELITKQEKEMLQFRKDAVRQFEAKFSNDKSKGTEECFNYDMIYFALFGNYTYI